MMEGVEDETLGRPFRKGYGLIGRGFSLLYLF